MQKKSIFRRRFCFRTDMYLYAVDPLLNVVVDMDQLQK